MYPGDQWCGRRRWVFSVMPLGCSSKWWEPYPLLWRHYFHIVWSLWLKSLMPLAAAPCCITQQAFSIKHRIAEAHTCTLGCTDCKVIQWGTCRKLVVVKVTLKSAWISKQTRALLHKRHFQYRNFCKERTKTEQPWATSRGDCVFCTLVRRSANLNWVTDWRAVLAHGVAISLSDS